jgi:CheY-like chemotaxis protein
MALILVIEDDAQMRTTLRAMLEPLGHQVVEAVDGKSGLAEYKKVRFDLVVTDLIMPGMDGVELIITLRKLNPAVKIIAISGGGKGQANDYLTMVKQLGAKRTLRKPFSYEEFTKEVQEELGLAGNDRPQQD